MYLISEVYIFEKLLFFPHYESYDKKKEKKRKENEKYVSNVVFFANDFQKKFNNN